MKLSKIAIKILLFVCRNLDKNKDGKVTIDLDFENKKVSVK